MTNSTLSFWWLYGAPVAAGVLRGVTATPLDAIATKEILQSQNTLQILKEMTQRDYWSGFQPNLGKFTTRTPLSFIYVKFSSSLIPTHLDPVIRGITLGILTGGMETITFNGWNSIRTRFIQGDRWSILKTEGLIILTKGLSAAFIHRAFSGAIFYGVYENLRARFPDQHSAVSTASGFTQVACTAPFYISAIHKQSKTQSPIRLDRLMVQLYRTRGFARGLFLPALAPRLALSAITSAPLMWLMEKLHLIHRKT
jgi:hypothetical protein